MGVEMSGRRSRLTASMEGSPLTFITAASFCIAANRSWTNVTAAILESLGRPVLLFLLAPMLFQESRCFSCSAISFFRK